MPYTAAHSLSDQEIKRENDYQNNDKQYYLYQQQHQQPQQPNYETNTLVYTTLNNSQPQHFSSSQNLESNRGLKRSHNETVLSDLDHKLYTNAVNKDQPQEVLTNCNEIKVKATEELVHKQKEDEDDDEEDAEDEDDDDDLSFNHDLVLSKILDEKKLALSYSPEVINFFNSLNQNVSPKH